jgi:ubiquinone/menaquinone biosynthesis C-methylase UbiE
VSRWTLDYDAPADIIADPHCLPFAENEIDLILLPHALEFTDDPHRMLREAYRVTRPEGQIVIAASIRFRCSARAAISAAAPRRRGTATSSRSTG